MAAGESIPGYIPDLTQMQTAAIALHERFTALMSAGFTEEQALRLISDQMTPRGTHD